MHREVDVAVDQRILDFFHEHAFAADVRQRYFLQSIARCFDHDDLACRAPRGLHALCNEPGLKEGQVTSSAAEAEGGHCEDFFVLRVEPAAVSVSSGVSSVLRPN